MIGKVILLLFAIAGRVSALWPKGAQECVYRPPGAKMSPSTDFTFNVTEKPEVPGLVEVDLYTDKKFEGILVTANFGPNDDGPNLSNGQWFSSSSLKLFRTMDWYCGITHQNREPKTGKHSFFYSPFPVGNFKWKKIGFRAIVIVNDDQVHEFFIPSGTA